jgi:CRISPR/Cas system CMR subunit Cmr4 (Cas7 group RAMP superfamily)
MITRPFLLHAFSPLHAGTGHAADVIDLPTARYKATGIPFVPGSSIKGVLRDARRTVDRRRSRTLQRRGGNLDLRRIASQEPARCQITFRFRR